MHSKNQNRHGSPCPSRSPLVPMKPKMSAVSSGTGDTLTFRVPRDYPHGRFSKAPLAVYPPKGARGKTCVSLPVVSLEKMPCLGRAEVAGTNGRINPSSSTPSSSTYSSSSSLSPAKLSLTQASSHRSVERLANGRSPVTPHSTSSPSTLDGRPCPGRSPLDRLSSPTPSPYTLDRKPSPSPSPRPSAPSSPLDPKQNGARNSKPQRRLSGRVFDPNKHCGVVDPDSKRACTRSLTCKTHSLTHRRAVPGRTKSFDILLAEHKSQAKEREGDGGQIRKDGAGLTTLLQDTTPKKPHSLNGRPISMLKLRLANSHISRVPGGVGGNGAALLSSTPVVAPVSAPASAATAEPASSWVRVGTESRMSSDEGGAKSPEDLDKQTSYRYSTRHPRPIGYCAFNSRLMGRGHYVFDRRWDRMRLALHCMVEKHVNAHIWRKVPLAADKLPSLSSTGNLQPPLSSPSSLFPQPVSSLSFPSSPEGFSLVSYTAAFPLSAPGAGVFSIREPAQPLAPLSVGKPRNGTTKPGNFLLEDSGVGAIKRKASSFSSSGSPRSNGGSYHPDNLLRLGTPGRKALGLDGSRLESRAEDLYSSLDPSSTSPYSHSRDFNPLPPAPSSPLAYGGGAEGRKRRSPSSYRANTNKMTKAAGLESILRRSNGTGLLAAGPQSPRQPRLSP